MPRIIMLIPIGIQVGLTSISLGIIKAIKKERIPFKVFKPISQSYKCDDALDSTVNLLSKYSNLLVTDIIKMSVVEDLIINRKQDILLEKIIKNFYKNIKNVELLLVEGLVATSKQQFIQSLNYEIAKVLHAEIVFLISPQDINSFKKIKEHIKLHFNCIDLSDKENINIRGIIINKTSAPVDQYGDVCCDLSVFFNNLPKIKKEITSLNKLSESMPVPILGVIPWNFDLITVRAIDIARHLNATIINEGDINTRRIKSIVFCSHTFTHILENCYIDPLLIISIDRHDLIIAACLAIKNGIKISAILLIDGGEINPYIDELYKHALVNNLPIFLIRESIWQTSLNLKNFKLTIPTDDFYRIKKIQEHVSNYIDSKWIQSLTLTSKNRHYFLSPPVFRYKLTEMARKANKRIILPEGEEPRTLKAAIFCEESGIATCILLGDQNKINQVAMSQGVKLDPNIRIINPDAVYEQYVDRLVNLRKDKGMTESVAREKLRDNVVLGTLMLEKGEVDGLVSGVIHTTANTIRPSLQLIKTAPGNSLVSSVFFMLLPEQVYIYGDCAVNQNPTAEQLAEIAIQSADTAVKFGINPYVAMLSYSTGLSGTGTSVEKVRKATLLAKEKRTDLIIDGPLQYDAAVMMDVAKFKAPHSPVAGRATVLIFPDLNTGNITYKAVQRSAKIISIGPMLQGMRKPVNDLSRGALVDDIIYTIALTAIQATQ